MDFVVCIKCLNVQCIFTAFLKKTMSFGDRSVAIFDCSSSVVFTLKIFYKKLYICHPTINQLTKSHV